LRGDGFWTGLFDEARGDIVMNGGVVGGVECGVIAVIGGIFPLCRVVDKWRWS